MKRFLLARDRGAKKGKTWVAREMCLMFCFLKGDTKGVELGTAKHMNCVWPLDAAEEAMGCVCQPYGAAGGREAESEMGGFLKGKDCRVVGEQLGTSSFPSSLSNVRVARESLAAHLFYYRAVMNASSVLQ